MALTAVVLGAIGLLCSAILAAGAHPWTSEASPAHITVETGAAGEPSTPAAPTSADRTPPEGSTPADDESVATSSSRAVLFSQAERQSSTGDPTNRGQGTADEESVVPPVAVEYPRMGAPVPVTESALDDDGQMHVPEDAAIAGWYAYGKAPASGTGTTVIAAHAGSVQTPQGPFYSLLAAEEGDRVSVEDAEGDLHDYAVTEVRQAGKEELDLEPYFRRSGAPELVLVTCGGQWIAEESRYADNIIVTARPIE